MWNVSKKELFTDFTWRVHGTASNAGVRFILSDFHFYIPVAATAGLMV